MAGQRSTRFAGRRSVLISPWRRDNEKRRENALTRGALFPTPNKLALQVELESARRRPLLALCLLKTPSALLFLHLVGLFDYIEMFYNPRRHYSYIGGVSPEAFVRASNHGL